jgi:hypothetical protein
MTVGGSESTTTPLDELLLKRPALLYPRTVVYTCVPEERGVAKECRKEVWLAGIVVGGMMSDPLGERPT